MVEELVNIILSNKGNIKLGRIAGETCDYILKADYDGGKIRMVADKEPDWNVSITMDGTSLTLRYNSHQKLYKLMEDNCDDNVVKVEKGNKFRDRLINNRQERKDFNKNELNRL